MGRLEGKVALITGAGQGIGAASAKLFAREGAKVVIAERAVEHGRAVEAAIRDQGGDATFVETDVADPGSAEAAVRTTTDRYGRIDVLYNNAGGATAKDGRVTEIELDEFWRTIGVDLFGTFLFCRLTLPLMAEQGGGSVINTTSIRALIGSAGADAYTSAKGGVLTLTKALALQWAEKKIRVNAIAPGVVLSERVRALVDETDRIYRKSILGPSEPEDVAPMALYLASDESRKVTGAILPVDSGASAI